MVKPCPVKGRDSESVTEFLTCERLCSGVADSR